MIYYNTPSQFEIYPSFVSIFTLGSYSLKPEYKKFQMKEEECQLRLCMSKDEINSYINNKFLAVQSVSCSTSAGSNILTPVKTLKSNLNQNNSEAPSKISKSHITVEKIKSFTLKKVAPSPVRGKDQNLEIEHDDMYDLHDLPTNWRQFDLNAALSKKPSKNFAIFSKDNSRYISLTLF